MSKQFYRLALAAVLTLTAAVPAIAAEPASHLIDPPPGPQDYIASLTPNEWIFGKLLWQGSDVCDADYCEAAFNASPVLLLVQKERVCCGGEGYSLTVVGRVKNCSSVSYYLIFSEEIPLQTNQVIFLSKRISSIAKAIASSCKVAPPPAIPTTALNKLFQ